MAEQGKYMVISAVEFEAQIKGGDRYEGLVDGVGYVYWASREVYFIQTNQNNLFAIPIYQQIINPNINSDKTKKVHTKT